MLGADPDLLDVLATQLTGAAQELQALEVRVGSAVRESPWQGLDAEGLRAQWISRDALQVIAAATQLESAATADPQCHRAAPGECCERRPRVVR
jgi:hypothetical protein